MKKFICCAFSFIFLFPSQNSAQKLDSFNTSKKVLISKKYVYIPAALMLSGSLLNGNDEESFKKEIAEERSEHLGGFGSPIDNYLQFSPIVIAYALDATGVKSATDIKNRTIILLKSEVLMTTVVYSVKRLTRQLRPDNSSYNSFPSGHTAQAFAAATFLSEEYKTTIKWIPFVAYGIASTVGTLRILNNKHYISDVLVGAGIGILSTKFSYYTHRYKIKQVPNISF